MHRLSFRAILLASFLLITASLAVAVAGAWRGMEAVVLAIQEDKQRALALSTAARALRERSVELERSARQYQVLGDPALARLLWHHPAHVYLRQLGPALGQSVGLLFGPGRAAQRFTRYEIVEPRGTAAGPL